MELRHLRYFVAVAEELNFRRAGDRLHVSHPTLSKQIGDLEDSIGVKLLARDTGSVRLTPAGGAFLQDARKLLAQADDIVTNARRAAGEMDAITIGTPGPFGVDTLFQALGAFRRKHPRINLQMIEVFAPQQAAALAQGRIQVGFVIAHDLREHPRLNAKLLLKSPMGAVLGKNHPLAKKKALTCADISKETFLCMGSARNNIQRDEIREMLPKSLIKTVRFKCVTSVPEIMMLLASCDGITFLPREFTKPVQEQILYRKVAGLRVNLDFEVWVIWRKDEKNPAVLDLISGL